MRDNPGRGELNPADDVRRHCKNNSSVLSCIGKRIKEGCDYGIGRDGGGPVSI